MKEYIRRKISNLAERNAVLVIQLNEIEISSLSDELIQADSKFIAVTKFECKYCEETLASKNDLKSHFQTVHVQEMHFKMLEMETIK